MNALIEVLYNHYFKFNSLPATVTDIMAKEEYKQTRELIMSKVADEMPAYIIKDIEKKRKAKEEHIREHPVLPLEEPPQIDLK